MFKKLGDSTHDFLQVLIPEFELGRLDNGYRIDLKLVDDMDSLRASKEKEIVNERYGNSEGEKKVKSRLDLFFNDPGILSLKVHCSDYPLRYANGGVLPIIKRYGSNRKHKDECQNPYQLIVPARKTIVG